MTPVVFIPGLLCDARLWRDQVDGLGDLATSTIADVGLDDSVGAMAARLLDAAPPRFTLVGLSMGGYVAFEVMRRAPQRVAALALLSTSAAPDTPARRTEREAGLKAVATGRFLGVSRRLLPRLVEARHLDGPVGHEIAEMARRVGGEAFLRQQTAILNRPDSRPTLGEIAVPTLVAVGDSDVMTPPALSIEIFRGLQRPSFHLFHGCGHLPPMEQPQATTALLRRWLIEEAR